MPDVPDMELVRQFARDHSETAFTELVRRHVNLVYSVARRCTGNDGDAQDVTQAVFIILAKKAAGLREKTILTGWLYETTRFTAARLLRGNARRHAREQEAFMQSTLNEADLSRHSGATADTTNAWAQLAPHLEDAMSKLKERDRALLVLRFYENKSGAEAAGLLGVSENTTHKRVARALEKLRAVFAKHGVTLSAAAIAGAVSTHSVQAAPAAIAKTISAVAIAKGATASSSTILLAKATLIAMKTKTIVTTIAASAFVLGLGGWFVFQSKNAPPPPPPPVAVAPADPVPFKFDNANFRQAGDKDGRFVVEVDPNTRRTADSAPAIHIHGPVAPAPNAAPFSQPRGNKVADNSSSARYIINTNSALFGNRVRITGWLKTSDVQNRASVFMVVWIKGSQTPATLCALDTMDDRPIDGTTDWQRIEIVTEAPQEPCMIVFGPDLTGDGEMWADDFQIDLAPPNAPVTDDSAWRLTSKTPNTYSEKLDHSVTHDGHSTVCLTYTGSGDANGQWAWWGQKIRPPMSDTYQSRTLRMTGWVKTENVSGRLQPCIRPWDQASGYFTKDSMSRDNSLTGTRDWTQFTVTCPIQKTAQHVDTPFILWGSGKVWIDMTSLKIEIVK